MSKYKDKYMQSYTNLITNILDSVGGGIRELTKTDILLITQYKKELANYEGKSSFSNILNAINNVLGNIGGSK